MKATCLALIYLFSVTCFAQAQEGQPEVQDSLQSIKTPKYELEPIVVTATRYARPVYRLPYAIDVVQQKNIQRAEVGLSLEEALRAVPAVVVNNRYNLAQGDRISLRGIGSRAPFGVRGIKIILDGIPLTMPDGQAQLNNLDLPSGGRIEVLRGPSSSLYGNAAGGLINMQTESAPSVPSRFQPRFIAGANGLRKWQGKVSGQIGRHQYLINANRVALDGFREHSAARFTTVNAVGRHQMTNQLSLTTIFNYFDAPYLLNPSSLAKADADTAPAKARFFVQKQGAAKKVSQGQSGLTLKYRGDPTQQLEATIYGLWRSLLNSVPGRIIDLDRKAGGIRTLFSKRLQVGGSLLRWTVGTDFETQNDTRLEFGNDGLPEDQVGTVDHDAIFDLLAYGPRRLAQDEQVLGIGPFAELELAPNPDWVITLGGRYDRYRFEVDDHFLDDNVDNSGTRTMDRFSPMLGLTYRPHRFINLYGNYATAFQTPTMNELGNRPTGEGGFNPDLRPEKMGSFELGLKGMWPEKRLTWDMAFYLLNIEDMLIPFQIMDPKTEEVFFRNAGKTRNRGAEVTLQWVPAKALQVAFAYTFMDFVFKDFQVETATDGGMTRVQLADNEVPGVPPHHLFAGVTYEHAGAYAEVNLQWVGQYFANDFNGPKPGSNKPVQDFINDAYLTVDLRLGLQREFGRIGGEFFLGINNLFNARYNGSIVPNAFGDRFFEPAIGRSWYMGAAIPFPNRGS